MKAIAVLVAAVAALGLPGAALGKGRNTLQVCGPEACTVLEDRAGAWYVGSSQESVFEPPPPSQYYRLYLSVEAGNYRHTHSSIFSPAEGLIAVDEGARRALLWYVPRTEALDELTAATRALEPYDAPTSWPLAVGSLSAAETGRDRGSYDVVLVSFLLAIAAGAGVAHRLAIRRPRTA